ncbi:MAG: MFS transporter [Promethearchaeati archaeon SRVP18_Atabeyarchaeia-1]
MSKEKTQKTAKVKVPSRRRTNATMNLANIVDNSDGQLFPTVYQNVQNEFAARGQPLTFTQLASVTAIRSVLQSVSTPIWGWWSDRHSRRKVLAFGCWFWGIFTLLTALSSQYIDMLIFRAITGIGLAVIIPTTNSLISDYYPPEKRGAAYGLLGLTGVIGTIAGTIFMVAMPLDPSVLVFGFTGWRFGLVVWSTVSVIIGLLVWLLVKDPLRGGVEPELAKALTWQKAEKYKVKRSDYGRILRNSTFLCILAQGVAGTIPWNGIMFMVQWFENIGFDPLTAGIMFVVIAVGAALGNFLGGWIGDRAARWRPKSGRIIAAQISVFSGIPMMFVIFLLIPMSVDSFGLYMIFGFLTGLLISWCGPINSSIFSDIFEPEIRASVFSVDRVFEGSVGALGTFFVGVITDITLFGSGMGHFEIAQALGSAMFLMAVIPWAFCLLFYTLVYRTYPKDFATCREKLECRGKELEKIK